MVKVGRERGYVFTKLSRLPPRASALVRATYTCLLSPCSRCSLTVGAPGVARPVVPLWTPATGYKR